MKKEELIRALEEDKKGNWDAAHEIVQQSNSQLACWIHAYLHRKEGDIGNAGYWYTRAGKNFPAMLLEEEWAVLYDFIKQLP